ncbi:MAG: hypothetical protein Q4A27_02380 [bacterium]|nr:hypothetical protein [bacterium]
MEPQKNVNFPKVEKSFSNYNFEGQNFENIQHEEKQESAQNLEMDRSHEAAFSALGEFEQNREIINAQPQLLPVDIGSIEQTDRAVVSSAPAKAADIDLMEDEWVKDLQKMILETKGDPFNRQVRFKEMQMDYLKKRYNRIINGGK